MITFVVTAKVLIGNGRYNVRVVSSIDTAIETARAAVANGFIDVKIETWENGEFKGFLTY